jgi:hypothetical protein
MVSKSYLNLESVKNHINKQATDLSIIDKIPFKLPIIPQKTTIYNNHNLSLYIVIMSFHISLYILFTKYVTFIDENSCVCAQTGTFHYIKAYIFFKLVLLMIIALLAMVVYNGMDNVIAKYIILAVNMVILVDLFVLLPIWVYTTLNYLEKLKSIDCICSSDYKEKMMYYYTYFLLSCYVSIAVFIIYSTFILIMSSGLYYII